MRRAIRARAGARRCGAGLLPFPPCIGCKLCLRDRRVEPRHGIARRLGTRASALALVRAAPTRAPMACAMSPARRRIVRGAHGASIMVDEGVKGPVACRDSTKGVACEHPRA